MPFKHESELRTEISKHKIIDYLKYDKTYVREEVPMGACIPDIVYVNFKDYIDFNFLPSNFSFFHAYIIWLLKIHKSLNKEEIAELCFETLIRIDPYIKALSKCGIIKYENDKNLFLTNDFLNLNAEVLAVEVKLSRWKDAIQQANNYKRFADAVYVALDSDVINISNELINTFLKNNVGLIKLNANEIETIVSPTIGIFNESPEKEYLVVSTQCKNHHRLWSCL